MSDAISLVKEGNTLFVRWQMPVDRWQMPVEKLIEYRQVLGKCASILKCSEAEVPERIQKLLDEKEKLLNQIGAK